MLKKNIKLFWWNEIKIQGKQTENYGDLLSKYLVEKISKKKVIWRKPSKFNWLNFSPIYFCTGSILTYSDKHCVVWGSGIISKEYPIKKATFLAVRGPKTREYLLKLGYNVPAIFGDPALLLPNYFNPKTGEKYKYGIIPHYNDMKIVKNWFSNRNDIHIINMRTNNIEEKTREILSCKNIISSSLHGMIVAHAYGIPAVWQKFSNKVFGDDIKYQDYMESVKLDFYSPKIKKDIFTDLELQDLFDKLPSLPLLKNIEELKVGLMKVCPFKN